MESKKDQQTRSRTSTLRKIQQGEIFISWNKEEILKLTTQKALLAARTIALEEDEPPEEFLYRCHHLRHCIEANVPEYIRQSEAFSFKHDKAVAELFIQGIPSRLISDKTWEGYHANNLHHILTSIIHPHNKNRTGPLGPVCSLRKTSSSSSSFTFPSSSSSTTPRHIDPKNSSPSLPTHKELPPQHMILHHFHHMDPSRNTQLDLMTPTKQIPLFQNLPQPVPSVSTTNNEPPTAPTTSGSGFTPPSTSE